MSTAAVALRMKVIGDQAAAAALQNLERKSQSTGRASQAAVERAAQASARAADQMQSRFGGAARQMASALENVARTGQATGEALKQVATQASDMAFMFGPKGAIVGAVAIAGIAVYNFFKRTRDEITETTRSAMRELAQMVRTFNVRGIGDQTTRMLFGDPGAAIEGRREGESERQFLARRLGVFGLEEERDRLRKAAQVKLASGGQADEELRQVREYQRALEELNATLGAYARALGQVQAITRAMGGSGGGSTAATGGGSTVGPGGIPLPPLRAGVTSSVTPRAGGGGISAGNIPFTSPAQIAELMRNSPAVRQAEAAAAELAMVIGEGFASTLGAAVTNAFATAFSGEGIGESLRSFGKTVLAGIGGIFQSMGAVYLKYGLIMESLAKFLPNPFTAGPAGVAIGVALMALGGALQGIASGGGGGARTSFGTGSASGVQVIDRGLINPLNPLTSNVAGSITARGQNVFNIGVVNPHDLTTQRVLRETIKHANNRGSL